MALKNQFNEQNKTTGVSETTMDTGHSDYFYSTIPARFFRLSYLIKIDNPGLLNVGVLTLVIRWYDGTSNKVYTSSALLLGQNGYIQDTMCLSVEHENSPAVPQPTYEIILTSLVGSPEYSYNLYVEAIPEM